MIFVPIIIGYKNLINVYSNFDLFIFIKFLRNLMEFLLNFRKSEFIYESIISETNLLRYLEKKNFFAIMAEKGSYKGAYM